jgi:hypothetical protein
MLQYQTHAKKFRNLGLADYKSKLYIDSILVITAKFRKLRSQICSHSLVLPDGEEWSFSKIVIIYFTGLTFAKCICSENNLKLDRSDSKVCGLKAGHLESFVLDLGNWSSLLLWDSQGYFSHLPGLIHCIIYSHCW